MTYENHHACSQTPRLRRGILYVHGVWYCLLHLVWHYSLAVLAAGLLLAQPPATNRTGWWRADVTTELYTDFPGTTHPTNGQDVLTHTNVDAIADRVFLKPSGAGQAPTYTTAALGGKSALVYHASENDHMDLRNDAGTVQQSPSDVFSASGWTIGVAFSLNANATSGAAVYDSTPLIGNQALGMYLDTTAGVNKLIGYSFDGAAKATPITGSETAFTQSAAHYGIVRLSSGTLFASVDGGTETSIASGNTTLTLPPLLIAMNYAGAVWGDVTIGEIVFYNAGLTGSNLTDLKTYLGRWLSAPAGRKRVIVVGQARPWSPYEMFERFWEAVR